MTEKNRKSDLKTETYYVRNALVNYYLVIMFSAFPLFFTDKYLNIRHDKYLLFLILSAVFVLASALTLVFNKDDFKRFIKLSAADIAFAVLVLCFTFSMLFSSYPLESFTGENGRNSGLLLFLAFFAVYVFVSRNFCFKSYVFIVFAITCLVVCALCVVNRFGGDPLGMYADMPDYVREDFVSTIGNRNIMSCFCCLIAPLFIVLFINNKSNIRFLYLSSGIVSVATIIICDSQSGLLGIVPTFAVLALYYIKNSDKAYSKRMFLILSLVCAAVVVVFVFLFIYFTFIDTETKLRGFMKFFRFNNKWGTHRGFIWKKSMEIFKGYSPKSLLFGCGPDTYYNVFEPYFDALYRKFGDASCNAAHNEFLNYLITTGVLGLASYLSLMITVIVRAFKSAKHNPMVLAFAAPVLCYLIQSTVNIATPITTPFLFIFIAICESFSRKQ